MPERTVGAAYSREPCFPHGSKLAAISRSYGMSVSAGSDQPGMAFAIMARMPTQPTLPLFDAEPPRSPVAGAPDAPASEPPAPADAGLVDPRPVEPAAVGSDPIEGGPIGAGPIEAGPSDAGLNDPAAHPQARLH